MLSGLEPDAVVILNPPDSLTDGVLVRIAAPPDRPAAPDDHSKDAGKTT